MADIPTPTTARKVTEVTLTQQNEIKEGGNIYGDSVLSCAKTGINHLFGVTLYNSTTYVAYSDAIVSIGDTIEDVNGTVFTITFKGSTSVPYLSRFMIEINGSIAKININE